MYFVSSVSIFLLGPQVTPEIEGSIGHLSAQKSVSSHVCGYLPKIGCEVYLVWAFYPFYGYLEGPSLVKSKALVSKL